MDDLALLVDLHRDGKRQGPGGDDETRLAIKLSGLNARNGLKIADIGCGTGASTLVLANEFDASVTAVDFLPDFIHDLDIAVERENLGEQIETLVASMDTLPFEGQSFDAIWSEGAIYNMGFANGIKAWRRFLKPDGILAVSELTWLTQERPAELEKHWMQEYPEVDTASEKMAILEEDGFSPVGYFALPKQCWLDNYYRPLQARFAAFLSRNGNSEAAAAIVAAEENEIALYERNAAFVSYGYYFICFFVLMTYEASLTQNPREALFASLGMILGKALVVGKFILIGDALGAGTKVRAPTLVHRVAWRTLSMTIVLVVLTLLENLILGWVHGERGGELINNLMDQTWVSFIAHVMLMLLILIPLITATEIVRALGTDGLNRLIQERQHRSAWTFEIELRAYSDRPYWNH